MAVLSVVAAVVVALAVVGLVDLADKCFSKIGAGGQRLGGTRTLSSNAGADDYFRDWTIAHSCPTIDELIDEVQA
jgi:hypothetical protein